MSFCKKIFKFVKNHRLLFSSIFMTLSLVLIFLPQIVLKLEFVISEETSGIELILYCSQIVSAIFVIAGTIIAVWQYYLSSSKRIRELEFSRVEKAIELSDYYKDNILYRYGFIKNVFESCGISSIITPKRNKYELREFDILELKKIYNEDEIKKLEQLSSNKKFIDVVIQLSYIYDTGISGNIKNLEQNQKSNNVIVDLSTNSPEIICDFFRTYVVQTLNNAEYFAMSFTHNTADESVIYQSIYPTFLEMCFVLYYYIARNSDPATAKLYTNIAELYRIWRNREQRQHEKYDENTRKGSREPGTIIEIERV